MSEIEVSTEVLKRRVDELERENRELRDQFEQVARDRAEYLQNVSHQLVAPLNAIKWHIENITGARVGVERAQKVMRSVYAQATLAVHLAKNFNLMSNLEADHALRKLKEPLREIELCRLLINLADDFQPLAWDQDIKITVERNHFDNIPPVLAMKPLIGQVFSNIIENAVKYSDRGSRIVIEGKYMPSSDSISVSVRNRGVPLNPADAKRVFDRGFRSPEAKRKYPAGTGFGLYIARRIVEIHKGTIEACSRDGYTVFEVTLSVKGLEGKARTRAS
ncbi:MAG: sensor histidine kinase [Thermodesulfobacteriota bacterium]